MFKALTFGDIVEAELREAWTAAAWQASARARAARAAQRGDLMRVAGERRAKKRGEKAKAEAKARASASGAKKAEAEAKRKEAEAKRAKAAQYDERLKGLAAELHGMRGDKTSAGYRAKYEQWRAVQDEKRVALGGAHRVEAPEKAKAPEDEKKAEKKKARATQTRYQRVPSRRNRGGVAAIIRRYER